MQVENIGYRLVEQNEKQYVGKEVAHWEQDLEPRERHFDKRVWVKTPLKAAGAYLLTAKMEGGNTTRIVVWVADTAIVKKPLDKRLVLLRRRRQLRAARRQGQPAASSATSSSGWATATSTRSTPASSPSSPTPTGKSSSQAKQEDASYQWIITATTPDGRLAYLGFTGIWGGGTRTTTTSTTRTRSSRSPTARSTGRRRRCNSRSGSPRPSTTRRARAPSPTAPSPSQITNPKGEKVQEKTYTADAYGGFDGELALPKDATLGVYNIGIINSLNIQQVGGETFRVEEYKKPEFEVKVDAPTEPVMLGEKITATVKCNYYFGAPVTRRR